MQGLTTVEFDNMRQTCRSIDHCLMESTTTNPPFLRHPSHLIDKCHEIRLPIPPSLPPQGSCPNPPQGTVRIRACQFQDFDDIRWRNPHLSITPLPQEHLVCEACRRNWHDNIGTNPNPGNPPPNPMSRHDWWRVKLATAHITVCSLCDREQKIQYDPVGHDGCVCYREYYKKRWLCRLCDIATGIEVAGSITEKTNVRQDLRQVGNEMKQMTGRQRPANLPQGQFWCPCGRQVSACHPNSPDPMARKS